MRKRSMLENACRSIASVIDIPLTLKMRTGVFRGANLAHGLISSAADWGVDMVTVGATPATATAVSRVHPESESGPPTAAKWPPSPVCVCVSLARPRDDGGGGGGGDRDMIA